MCLFCLCGILLAEKNDKFVVFFCPKQPGFVRVCQSCEEEAPVGETFFHVIRGPKCALLLFSCYSIVLEMNKKFCYILFQLSNHQFEELAMDVYDEVDRRETDAGKIARIKCKSIHFHFNFYLICYESLILVFFQCGWPLRITAHL